MFPSTSNEIINSHISICDADYAHLIRQPALPAEESTVMPISNEGDALNEYSDEVLSSEEEVSRDDPPKPPHVDVEVVPHR